MKFKPYKQTTYETCLSCCLLQALEAQNILKVNKALETDCLLHSLKTSKEDFAGGHLDFIVRRFKAKATRILDSSRVPWRKRQVKGVTLQHKKINLKLIDQMLGQGHKPIIQLDSFNLFGAYHYPHWVTVLDKKKGRYIVFDTWFGKPVKLKDVDLSNAVISLREYVKLPPQIIAIWEGRTIGTNGAADVHVADHNN